MQATETLCFAWDLYFHIVWEQVNKFWCPVPSLSDKSFSPAPTPVFPLPVKSKPVLLGWEFAWDTEVSCKCKCQQCPLSYNAGGLRAFPIPRLKRTQNSCLCSPQYSQMCPRGWGGGKAPLICAEPDSLFTPWLPAQWGVTGRMTGFFLPFMGFQSDAQSHQTDY